MNDSFATQTHYPSCSLRSLMAFDRDRTLDELDEFVAKVEVDDRKGSMTAWRRFEMRLGQRLSFEEELLLPAFAEARAVDARRLRDEHEQLRLSLRRLGANSELHLLRAEHLRQFFKMLRLHSHHKDALYAWAELHLSPDLQRQILEAVRRQADDVKPPRED
jgi:hypothetical protein